jgi:hypothetical protein
MTTTTSARRAFALGYRALHQDYDDKDVEWDVTMHGPFIGTATRF